MDLSPLRSSRDLRLLVLGSTLTGLGTQATLIALPYQLYVQTHSAAQTGLLGAFELVPLVGMSLYGGALADRVDRRRMLLLVQIALVALTAALAAGAYIGHPPVLLLYVLGGLLAGGNSLQTVLRTAIIPNVVPPGQLRPALAVSFGLMQVTLIVGPALGGILIAVGGLGSVYTLDAVTCLAMVATVSVLAPQPPRATHAPHPRVWHSIVEGLRFVRTRKALVGSFAIDLSAMTFGMPRTLFPVLSVSVYHAGATGTGLLNASVAVGATVAALTAGWLGEARRLGRIVIAAVVVWGAAIAVAGAVPSLWLAVVMLAVAGAADSVSAVCRTTINQTVTPDAMRGRMSSIFSLVVQGGPRMGDLQGGAMASLTSARFTVVGGGLVCIAAAGAIALAFPALVAYDAKDAEAELAEATAIADAAAAGGPS